MTNDLAIMLIGPITALICAVLMGTFIIYRINRYGRVFNWSPFSQKPKEPPTRPRTEP
jgi:hypothetical protein